ncbi:hypothetical protein JSR02_00530 [Candidatus Vidania fulgoroideae]|uniref:Homoserine dehydrogenase catalytic domain-containing protein n=1 Tax=Candidatus Vidania fulgoroideorum TaxID=881286 RepID=A0A974X725_9PROT|nr:hypothetical protein JSR02_00530 [Candidatus Vidania fulgoroideae]
MKYLLLVGFGNIARSFFASLIYKNFLEYSVILVLRINNWAYKALINSYLRGTVFKVVVVISYKGIVNCNNCLVVELIGDNYYARDLLLRTLLTSNCFLTANKFLLYKNIRLVSRYLFTRVFFEAAIGGGLPFVKNFLMLRTIATVKSCCAIFNGTTNFLLTLLPVNDFRFDMALKESAILGLSEANPVKDICGFDALNKIVITAYLLCNKYSYCKYIYVTSLPVDNWFYWFVSNLGYTYRYVSFFIIKGYVFHIEVSLCLFKTVNSFTLTYFDYNSVTVVTKLHGYFTIAAKGAGATVTTYSLLSDFEYFSSHCGVVPGVSVNSSLYAMCLFRSFYIFLLDLEAVPDFFMLLLLLRCVVSFFITTKLVVLFKFRLGFSSLRKLLAFFRNRVLYCRVL